MPESYVQYNPDTGRVLVFGPGGFVDLGIPLEDARRMATALDIPVKIVGQSIPPSQ